MAWDLAANERKRVWTVFSASPVNKEVQKRLQAFAIVGAFCPLVNSGDTNASQETLALASKAYPKLVKTLRADGLPVDGFTWPAIWEDKLFHY